MITFSKPININDLTNERFIEIFSQYKRKGCFARKRGFMRKHDRYYLNKAITFDTESTSIIVNGEKQSWVYIWQMCFDGYVFYSRDLYEFAEFINAVSKFICVDERHFIMIYVHNLAFDFQFIRKYFDITKVFALKARTPIYAIAPNIEFRCSYILTNKPLAKLASEVSETGLKKLVGDLDYKTIRTPNTPMTQSELEYCFNDVRLLCAYIDKQITIERYITEIPLTSTGYVRRYCRNQMKHDEMKLVKSLTIECDEYSDLLQAFAGGFTHSNPYNTNIICNNVSSFDFTSSYPYCMLSETFPMSKGKRVDSPNVREFARMMKRNHLLIKARFTGLRAAFKQDFYLSQSKAMTIQGALISNGRVVSCDYCEYMLTEIDFGVICTNYEFDDVNIDYCWVYEKDYLPMSLIESIIKFYRDKTTLKGVKGKELEYMNGKAMLNSIYGMCVTNPLQDVIEYAGEWIVGTQDPEALSKYNKDKKRFIFYPWGVWVTAYARRNLWTGICEFGTDYIYSDTDSVKVMNKDNHADYIREYNTLTEHKLKAMCRIRGIDYELLQPKTIDGRLKPLGVWDFEETYTHFKTLGAKRYAYQHNDGTYSFTISGLPKRGCSFIGNQINPMEYFSDGMTIPQSETGKLIHTYIDDEQIIDIVDYTGKRSIFKVPSACHLWESDFTLTLSSDYKTFLAGIKGLT